MKFFSPTIIFFFFFWPFAVCAQNHVGIILAGYEENCEVNHRGAVYDCIDRRELYIGDTVKKKPSVKSLKIKWAPYVRGAERGQTYLEVVANKPETLKGSDLTSSVKQYINDFVKVPAYGTATAATRDPKGKPSPFIFLHYDYPLKITKTGGDRFVFVLDSQGKKIWEARVQGGRDLLINPKELPLNTKEKYTLTIETGVQKRVSPISLMDETLQAEITKGFADLEREKSSTTELIIKKVTFCQIVSDVYPDKADLYWLGNQFLEENILKPSDDQKEVVDRLKKRYLDHLRTSD